MRFNLLNMHPSWNNFILDKRTSKKLKKIEKNLKGIRYFPSRNKVFRFMKNDLNNVKYIIIGMDPYPQSYVGLDKNGEAKSYPVATGRSFEPANYNSWTESTKNKSITNILKAIYVHETNTKKRISEIRKEIKNNQFKILPPHEFFDSLEKQGVLFLNSALTVEPEKPGSHIDLWREFSIHLIQYIDTNYNVKWVLLGEKAQELDKYITHKKNIIKDVHPIKNSFCTDNKSLQYIKVKYTK